MSKTEALPGLTAASLTTIAKSLSNVDQELADDYRWEAYFEALRLGALAVEDDSDCPALLTLYNLDNAFYEGYDTEIEGRQAEDACNNCDQKNGQCYSGCPWV